VKTTVDVGAGQSITLQDGTEASLTLQENAATLPTGTLITLQTGGAVLISGKVIALNASDEISLTCGAASLSLKKDGIITAKGPTEVSLESYSSKLMLEPATADLKGSNVNVRAAGMMVLHGAFTRINCSS
jgi:type VI secretion system secreted protein VgrG